MSRTTGVATRCAPSISIRRDAVARRWRHQRRRAAVEPEGVEKETATSATTGMSAEVLEAVGKLQEAVETTKFDPSVICDAFQSFQRNKAEFDDDLSEAIGGGPGGKYWQLQFVSNLKGAEKDKKGGYRFPLTAIQHFENGKITNGAFLGHIASLRFVGTYETDRSLMKFMYEKMELRIGPGRFAFPVGTGSAAEGRFVFFYADEDFVVARGQSGGTAFWKRISPSDLLQFGAT